VKDERPILEVRQSAWQVSSVRDQRLRIFGDRVELVRPKITSEARTTAIPFAEVDYISVKRFLMVWFDLVIVPKSGTAIRLRPLAKSDAEHAEDLIKRPVGETAILSDTARRHWAGTLQVPPTDTSRVEASQITRQCAAVGPDSSTRRSVLIAGGSSASWMPLMVVPAPTEQGVSAQP
jgi:hypothetical protein